MTTIQQKLATGRGKFTTDYPDLSTAPVAPASSSGSSIAVPPRLPGPHKAKPRLRAALSRPCTRTCRVEPTSHQDSNSGDSHK
jgi:hypothetical protein